VTLAEFVPGGVLNFEPLTEQAYRSSGFFTWCVSSCHAHAASEAKPALVQSLEYSGGKQALVCEEVQGLYCFLTKTRRRSCGERVNVNLHTSGANMGTPFLRALAGWKSILRTRNLVRA
jgi:hypothetical protein